MIPQQVLFLPIYTHIKNETHFCISFFMNKTDISIKKKLKFP